MCGIFAAMTRHGISSDRCDAALKLLEHRGPDGSGIWTSRDGQWTLGHTRLSIIGLRNGSQPMTSPDGAVHVVVNGEFYGYREIRERLRASGYRFSTESDSEIAVHLYRERGMQAATLLRGEFAVVIADERQRAMIASAIRDRFGVKPLYYAVVNGDVFFASEIKALLALGVPAAWDLEGAIGGMGRSHEKTEFAGISTVPPGCYAIARDGDVRIYPCWDWEIPTAEQMRADTRSDAEIVDEFREVLRDAVRQRLVADVEVASYLSGGIDSCAVLGLAQQEMERPIRAFTLTFENPLYDEASIAEAQAKHVGATYHPIPITGREIADSFADAIWHSETQMFNGHGVAKYLLSRAVRAAGIKVVFTGEGADEMLGGYPYFRVDALNDNAALSAGERAALLDEMLGANPATRAILMPEQVDSSEMQAVERRLGWLPAPLNVPAAQMNSSRIVGSRSASSIGPATQSSSSAGIAGGSSLSTLSTSRRGRSGSGFAVRCADRTAGWSGRSANHITCSNLSTVWTGLMSNCCVLPRNVKRLTAFRTKSTPSESFSINVCFPTIFT
jgi:asparagine synthase (glutamine-hydrolysing)